MIMAEAGQLTNRLKSCRLERGWSQVELARRAGISRAAVSAIEVSRLAPSVTAALALAAAFGRPVEDLFGLCTPGPQTMEWAWRPPRVPCRYWHARVGRRTLLYPAEATAAGVLAHDGVHGEEPYAAAAPPAESTLVLAGCDPAAGLLADAYARLTGFRLLALQRSSEQALDLLGQGLVHVAGLHLVSAGRGEGNRAAVRQALGSGFRLLRLASWQEGLALRSALGIRSVTAALRTRLRWVGRERGSGAQQCLEELLAGRSLPRRLAHDHRGVAEAVRCGWADAGVCVRLVCEEAAQGFLPIREEAYDFCYPAAAASDPRIRGLIGVLQSAAFRRLLGELPGYDTAETGEERAEE
jgi:molybdate-binding protein/DNA-binding XRE family transcriptional regulator